MDVSKYALKSDHGEKAESVQEIFSSRHKINRVMEDADNYYVVPDNPDPYDHLMWYIEKATGKTGWLDMIEFIVLGIEEQATIVDPPYNELKIGS